MAFGFPTVERRLFVVTCKRCRRDVAAGRDDFPFQSITVECPLVRRVAPVPSYPEMRASFFAMGEGIARGRDLGIVDMRQIAPTVASILGVSLPTAKEPKLNLAR